MYIMQKIVIEKKPLSKELLYYYNKTNKIRHFMYNTGIPILNVKYDNKHIFYKTDENIYRGFYY